MRKQRNTLFLKKTIAVADKRYSHFDIVAKVVTLELEGLDAGLRYDDVRRAFLENASFSAQSAVAKRISRSLDLLADILPEPFPLLRNRTIVQSVVTLTCHLLNAGISVKRGPELKSFIEYFVPELRRQVELGQQATDADFISFQRTVNANVRSGARTRQLILLKKLFREHPGFFSSLADSSELTSNISAEIHRLGDSISELVSRINERYAAKNGIDLFKPTNKTVKALGSIGRPITTLTEYKSLIEHLYFVFRESAAGRLGDDIPQSFRDANDLRTMLQHDVDHGKASKVSSKRKSLGSAFAKYSGVTSPDLVDPISFPLIQANILGALEIDLRSIAKSFA